MSLHCDSHNNCGYPTSLLPDHSSSNCIDNADSSSPLKSHSSTRLSEFTDVSHMNESLQTSADVDFRHESVSLCDMELATNSSSCDVVDALVTSRASEVVTKATGDTASDVPLHVVKSADSKSCDKLRLSEVPTKLDEVTSGCPSLVETSVIVHEVEDGPGNKPCEVPADATSDAVEAGPKSLISKESGEPADTVVDRVPAAAVLCEEASVTVLKVEDCPGNKPNEILADVTPDDAEAGPKSLISKESGEPADTVVDRVPAAAVCEEAGSKSSSETFSDEASSSLTSHDFEANNSQVSNVPADAVTSDDTEAGTKTTSVVQPSVGRYIRRSSLVTATAGSPFKTPPANRRPFPRTNAAHSADNVILSQQMSKVSPTLSADTGLSVESVSPDHDLNHDQSKYMSVSTDFNLPKGHVHHPPSVQVSDEVSADMQMLAKQLSKLSRDKKVSSSSKLLQKYRLGSFSTPSTPQSVSL